MSIPTFSWLTTFKQLQLAGATYVEIAYSGGGDSGGVDSVSAAGEGIEGNAKIAHLIAALGEPFQNWVGEHLMPQHGWWNNAGGCGTITIDLETLEATVEHTDYSDDSESAEPFTRPLPEALAKQLKAATGAPPQLYGSFYPDNGWDMQYYYVGEVPESVADDALVTALLDWASDRLEEDCPVDLGDDGAQVDLELDVEAGSVTFEISVCTKAEHYTTFGHELLDELRAQ